MTSRNREDGNSYRRLSSRARIRRWYTNRYNAFRRAGFTENEARWAAENNLKLKDQRTKEVLAHRGELVRFLVSRGMSRDEAEAEAARRLMDIVRRRGEEDRGPVVFYQGSP